jgi:mannose-6-phosphate isomerase-like protein (cupin superfamily)
LGNKIAGLHPARRRRYGEDAKSYLHGKGLKRRETLDAKEERMQGGVAHLRPGEGRSLWVLGELATYKTSSEQTGGAYSLFEVITPPGTGAPPHVQHREDESFYVLEGEYAFSNGEETLRVGAGSLLYVPKGTLHAHKNVGEGVGRMLVTQTPGGLYEHFFEGVGVPGETALSSSPPAPTPEELQRMVELGREYGTEYPPFPAW